MYFNDDENEAMFSEEGDYECDSCGCEIYATGRNSGDYISYVNSGYCSSCEREVEEW